MQYSYQKNNYIKGPTELLQKKKCFDILDSNSSSSFFNSYFNLLNNLIQGHYK
jgi:hypothetical protein